MPDIVGLIKFFLQQLPSFAAMAACMVFAITRWKRYPKVAMFVTIGLAFLFLHQIVFTLVYFFVPSYFIRSAGYAEIQTVMRNVYLVIGFISNSLAAIGMIVLLTGIFIRRKPEAAT